jgi:hypothetical protein
VLSSSDIVLMINGGHSCRLFLFSKLSYAILSATTLSPMLIVGRATAVAGAADMMLDIISIVVIVAVVVYLT